MRYLRLRKINNLSRVTKNHAQSMVKTIMSETKEVHGFERNQVEVTDLKDCGCEGKEGVKDGLGSGWWCHLLR